jgi:hypothetical protein
LSDRPETDLVRRPSRGRILAQSGSLIALACIGLPRAAYAAAGDQNEWRFCSKCGSMFWNGGDKKGVCAAGGTHLAQGFLFALHYDDAPVAAGGVQYGWRYCSKCSTLFYSGFATKGHCPAGGAHFAQGFNFGLSYQAAATAHAQTEWRFCDRCFALFWNGGSAKGRCPAGGGHNAQGFTFSIPYTTAITDPGAAVSDALASIIQTDRGPIQDYLKSQLGRGDLLAKGYTLYDLNLRLGTPAFQSAGLSFNYRLPGNYLYLKSTTPTVLGSEGDPAFEIHFDVALVGAIVREAERVRVQGLVASVPSVTVKPRNVTGGIVTTFVHFFAETAYGGRVIRQAVDKYLRQDLTERVNAYLQQF